MANPFALARPWLTRGWNAIPPWVKTTSAYAGATSGLATGLDTADTIGKTVDDVRRSAPVNSVPMVVRGAGGGNANERELYGYARDLALTDVGRHLSDPQTALGQIGRYASYGNPMAFAYQQARKWAGSAMDRGVTLPKLEDTLPGPKPPTPDAQRYWSAAKAYSTEYNKNPVEVNRAHHFEIAPPDANAGRGSHLRGR